MVVSRVLRQFMLVLVGVFFLAGCTNLRFKRDSVRPGLLDIGQQLAHESCQKHADYEEYRNCLVEIDASYAELRRRQERSRTENRQEIKSWY